MTRVYPRKFDHDEARARFDGGESLTAIARSYGVAHPTIKRVVDPDFRALADAYRNAWGRGRTRVYVSTPEERARKAAAARHRYATDPAYREKRLARANAAPKIARQARHAVAEALKRGDLVRASVCEQCGDESYCEAAHSDYSRPLEVRWLCRPCHRRWDRSEPKAKAT